MSVFEYGLSTILSMVPLSMGNIAGSDALSIGTFEYGLSTVLVSV